MGRSFSRNKIEICGNCNVRVDYHNKRDGVVICPVPHANEDIDEEYSGEWSEDE